MSILELVLSTMVIINSVLLLVLGTMMTAIMINFKNITPAIFDFPKKKPVKEDEFNLNTLNNIL